jgi:hypothetical protein
MSVIHDFDDENALRLLRAVRAAAPTGARILLLELLLPEDPTPATALYLDVIMLTVVGGRERTQAQYEALLSSAGFAPTRVIPTASGLSILAATA